MIDRETDAWDRGFMVGWFFMAIAGLLVVGYIELDRAAALSALTTQIEIAAGQSEVNTLRAKLFQREIERRENRCFHWGGK